MRLNQVSKMFGIASTEPGRAYYNRELVWAEPNEYEPPVETGYLVGWYDAADNTTITTNTTDIQTMSNKAAGNNGNFTVNAIGFDTPQYGLTQHQIAGKNTIMFTGNDSNSKFKAGQHAIDDAGTLGTFEHDTTWFYDTRGHTPNTGSIFKSYPSGSNNPVYLTIVRYNNTDWACIRTHECATSPFPGNDPTTWIDATAYLAGRPGSWNPNIGNWSRGQPYGSNTGNKNNLMYYATNTAAEWVEKTSKRLGQSNGQSPFLNSTHTDSMSGHTILAVYKALVDPDHYRGSPRTITGSDYIIEYDFPEEGGRGNMFMHHSPLIQSHAPWERGNLYYDTRINNVTTRVNTSWQPDQSKDTNPTAVNEDWSFWSTFGTPTLLSYMTNTHLGEHCVFVDGEKRLARDIPSNETYEISPGAKMMLGGGSWQGAAIFCEMLIFDDAIDRSSQTILEGYLAHKWLIHNQLPSWHTYKSAPPSLDLLNERFDMDLSSANYTVYTGSQPTGE